MSSSEQSLVKTPNPKRKRKSSSPYVPCPTPVSKDLRPVKTPTRTIPNHVTFSFQNNNADDNPAPTEKGVTLNTTKAPPITQASTSVATTNSGAWHDDIIEESSTVATTEETQTTRSCSSYLATSEEAQGL